MFVVMILERIRPFITPAELEVMESILNSLVQGHHNEMVKLRESFKLSMGGFVLC